MFFKTLPPFLLLALYLAFTTVVMAQDSNIVISSSKSYYEFTSNKKSNTVSVKENLVTSYTCNSFRTTVPVTEFYNNLEQIDKVSLSVDGNIIKKAPVQYTYYSSDDIFYTDERICYLPLVLEKQGSTGEVSFEKTVKDPKYFSSIYFSQPYKVINGEVTIKVPRWMHVDLKEMNFEGFGIKKNVQYKSSDDADIYTYNMSNLPAMRQEQFCPGPTYLYPHLLVLAKSATVNNSTITYFNTLADQYAWYHQLVKDIDNDEAALQAKAKEITTGITDDMEKIKAIFYWVQNNIRYIAFEDGIAGFRPAKADEVLRKKYGDCKGMAHLTKELLKAAGFDARLCWLGTNHIAYNYSTPSMAVDNHMICALLYKGKTYFLDATEAYLGFNEYAERIQNRQVLIEDGDNFIFTQVPATTSTQNLAAETRKLTINGTSLSGTVQDSWKGEEKEMLLATFNSVKKDESEETFRKYLSNDNTNCTITALKTSDLTNYDGDITAAYDVVYKNAVSSFDRENYIDLDYKKELSDMCIDTAKRYFDFWLPYKMNIARETELTIPTGYKISTLPSNLDIASNDYHFSITYTQEDNKIIYRKHLIFNNAHISKASFSRWNTDINKLIKAYKEQVILAAL
jgi:transglutaminase-like putative cysteine protease